MVTAFTHPPRPTHQHNTMKMLLYYYLPVCDTQGLVWGSHAQVLWRVSAVMSAAEKVRYLPPY